MWILIAHNIFLVYNFVSVKLTHCNEVTSAQRPPRPRWRPVSPASFSSGPAGPACSARHPCSAAVSHSLSCREDCRAASAALTFQPPRQQTLTDYQAVIFLCELQLISDQTDGELRTETIFHAVRQEIFNKSDNCKLPQQSRRAILLL